MVIFEGNSSDGNFEGYGIRSVGRFKCVGWIRSEAFANTGVEEGAMAFA